MKKFLTYLITILTFALVCVVLYTNAIDVGLKLRAAHPSMQPYLEITYYVLVIVVVYALILNPLFTVLFSPYYSIAKYCSKDNKKGNIRGRVRKILKANILDEEETKNMENLLNDHDNEKLAKRLYIVYNNQIREQIDKIVVATARDTMMITAISQSNLVDNITILASNMRMIKKIVLLCGFRPTFLRVCKLYIRVFVATLVAEGINRLDVSSLISTSIKGAGKIVTNSAISGAINALFILRIGMLTKNYLYADHPQKEKFSIRNNSFTEAMRLFPSVLSSLITSPIKGIASMFKPNEVDDGSDEEEEIIAPKVKWRSKKKENR